MMKTLNNTDGSRKGRDHYLIEINGISYSYCYIRKNACSAFKDLFMHESIFAMDKGSSLANMVFYHSCSQDQVISADYRVVVLRDPISRVASVFQNKFVQQLGFFDVFTNYNRITGMDPRMASFNDFVFHYLDNPVLSLDVHMHPQVAHLHPVDYNAACDVVGLYDMSVEIFGSTLANKYFKNKRNSSHRSSPLNAEFLDYPAHVLNDLYFKTGQVPDFLSIMNSEHIEFLEQKYSADIKLYRDFIAT